MSNHSSKSLTRHGLKVGLFSNFYPLVGKAGPHSLDLALMLSQIDRVASVTVFAPTGSALPQGLDSNRIHLCLTWARDDPISLARALMSLVIKRRDFDVYIFDTILTNYGDTPLVNLLGLIGPAIVRVIGRTKVAVYCHSYLETQDVGKIGFQVNPIVRWGVHTLERVVLTTCKLVVPLSTQQIALQRSFGVEVEQCFLPYYDAIYSAVQLMNNRPIDLNAKRHQGKANILFFGTWGPQKDLGIVETFLERLLASGLHIRAILAGSIHTRFLTYREKLLALAHRFPPDFLELDLDEAYEVSALRFIGADAVVLPYAGSGGLSGVFQHAALYGRPIVATDLPEIREMASRLGHPCMFFPVSNPAAGADQLIELIDKAPEPFGVDGWQAGIAHRIDQARQSTEILIDKIMA
jgi:prepilin-type processing-associated H-X9-DG protein